MEVKTLEEIRATVDRSGKNRGLEFAPEMMQYCGRRFVVLSRVEKIIMETTAKMLDISDTVILEAAACDGCFHRGCARNHYFHWREIWLKRVNDPAWGPPSAGRENPFLPQELPVGDTGQPDDCSLVGVEEPRIPDPYLRRLEMLLETERKSRNGPSHQTGKRV